jgi:hypothetical protein
MNIINLTLVVEVIKALAWPIVAAFALYLLRRPLVELLGQLARRAKKLAIFEVSVELTTLPELQPQWSVGGTDVRRLSSSQIFSSGSQGLFQELLKPVQSDYVIVDVRSGQAWLTSRLFIFSLILGEVTGLRAFVFLESAASTRRRFLGVATPANVRRALGRRYPWLEEAVVRALTTNLQNVQQVEKKGETKFFNWVSPFAPNEWWQLSGFVGKFVQNLQRTTDPPENERRSYLDLELDTGPKTWERAHWIDGERLERDLVGVIDYAWVDEALDSPRSFVFEAVIRRNASFVALVDSDRRFIGLVDRYALLTQTSIARNGTVRGDRDAS